MIRSLFDPGRSLQALSVMGLACMAALHGGPITAQDPPQDSEDLPEVLGKRSPIQMGTHDSEWIRVDSGTEIHERPSRTSAVVEIIADPAEFEILGRQGSWMKILYQGWIRWVLPSADSAQTERGLPLHYTPDEERLLRARSILADGIEPGRLGPFEVYTDIEDTELLDRLAAVAANLTETYKKRFKLDPGTRVSEVVVIFSDHDDYLRFESGEPDIAGTGTRGYTGRGISVLSTGGRDLESAIEILVHELTHILNRRVFGMNSPAWVEEGLADDLAYCRVDPNGVLQLGTLGGITSREVTSDISGRYQIDYEITGGRSMLTNLLAKWGDDQRPSVVELLEMPWLEFIQPEARPLHYAESAFFVRYLLAAKKGAYAQALHDYLRALAATGMPQGDTIWNYIDDDPAKVESGYFRWLRQTATANGL